MIHRRLFALLTAAALLHLSVVAGDAACATHGASAHAGAADGHAMAMDAHHADGVHAVAAGSDVHARAAADAAPCETPVQPRCCFMQVGCSVASALAGARPDETPTPRPMNGVRASRHDVPASFAPAPEPPPPRR